MDGSSRERARGGGGGGGGGCGLLSNIPATCKCASWMVQVERERGWGGVGGGGGGELWFVV